MWEMMVGRKPFWHRSHDTFLIIDICKGTRPEIVTNVPVPVGYVELMQECWQTKDHVYRFKHSNRAH